MIISHSVQIWVGTARRKRRQNIRDRLTPDDENVYWVTYFVNKRAIFRERNIRSQNILYRFYYQVNITLIRNHQHLSNNLSIMSWLHIAFKRWIQKFALTREPHSACCYSVKQTLISTFCAIGRKWNIFAADIQEQWCKYLLSGPWGLPVQIIGLKKGHTNLVQPQEKAENFMVERRKIFWV